MGTVPICYQWMKGNETIMKIFPYADAIRQTIDKDRIYSNLEKITHFHRFQFTDGLADADRFIVDTLKQNGIEAYLEWFPADPKVRFWSFPSKPVFHVERACAVLEDEGIPLETLADFDTLPMSVAQYSYPYYGCPELEFVSENETDEEIAEKNIAGKIVLTDAWIDDAKRRFADRFGAVGLIVYDIPPLANVRKRKGFPNARYQTSFNWTYEAGEIPCFGIVLTPEMGERIRDMIAERKNSGRGPLTVSVDYKTRLETGKFPVAVGVIPGETDQEVVVVSHICHSMPCANDNGSGNAAELETALVLGELIREGKLPKPRRTLRFLWVTEMSGSYAWLSAHEKELGRIITGINMDMVGGDEKICGNSLLIESPADSCPSYAAFLLERIRREVCNDSTSHTGMDPYPLFRCASASFAGASDHLVFCDPSVGIPMPQLFQYPDKFHHTSLDTMANIDREMLAKNVWICTAYMAFLASAGTEEKRWLQRETEAGFAVRVMNIWKKWTEADQVLNSDEFDSQMDYLLSVYGVIREKLDELSPEDTGPDLQLPGMIEAYKQEYRRLFPDARPYLSVSDMLKEQLSVFVPVRTSRGPAAVSGLIKGWTPKKKAEWGKALAQRTVGGNTLPFLTEFWIDGRRNGMEIAKQVFFETGVWDPEIVLIVLEMLKTLGLIR